MSLQDDRRGTECQFVLAAAPCTCRGALYLPRRLYFLDDAAPCRTARQPSALVARVEPEREQRAGALEVHEVQGLARAEVGRRRMRPLVRPEPEPAARRITERRQLGDEAGLATEQHAERALVDLSRRDPGQLDVE